MDVMPIEVDARATLSRLQAIKAFLLRRKPLEIAGREIERHNVQAFEASRDPQTGAAHRPNRPNTVAAKVSAQVLVASGRMGRSLRKGAPGNIYQATGRELRYGTRDPNAAFAQYGTRPHSIKPKSAKVLRFRGTGGVAYARSVRHPGTPVRRIVGVSRDLAMLIQLKTAARIEQEARRGK